MKAWVVTIISLDALKRNPPTGDEAVIALISARRSARQMEDYVENIAHILLNSLDEQKVFSSYSKKRPKNPYLHNDCSQCICFYRNPYMINAQYSDILGVFNVNGVSWVRWKGVNYSRFEVDKFTHQIKKSEDVDPPIKERAQANFDLSTRGIFNINR